jgi:V8-like Glu-specific endopeptidase
MNLSISEQLAYNTVRITSDAGTGTGFIYKFAERKDGLHVPAIVTNKHVIEGASKGQFLLTLANEQNEPIDTEHFTCSFNNFESLWHLHPDKEVDLCAMPIAPILSVLSEQKKTPFYIPIDKTLLPTANELNDLRAVEDILMVGYPNGLWDAVNNMPLFRQGITASHPRLDWNGKEEMLIDAACFPGSSGSPVFLFNEGGYVDKSGTTNLGGTRVKLLGILYAGPQHTAEGEIQIVTVPTVEKPLPVTGIPNNIGITIKAEKLNELDDIFNKLLTEQSKT